MKKYTEIFNNTKSLITKLRGVDIKIVFIPMCFATMNCKPTIISFVFPWEKCSYVISVNSKKNFSRYSVPIDSLNETILTGWFAHELGHVIQYEKMSLIEFIMFPFKYFFDLNFRKSFEVEATQIAEVVGFKNECNEAYSFLNNDPRVHKKYKERFKRFYILD